MNQTEINKAAYLLMWVWIQYGSHGPWEANETRLTHANMGAGEEATEWLERHGFVKDNGYAGVITEKGKRLLGVDSVDDVE